MKYENAKDVLPKELFDEVQKHAAGRLLYFPIAGKRRPWGERTGIRSQNRMRNEEIRARFRDGVSVEALAREYHLTQESVKNIIYSKKGIIMDLKEILSLYGEGEPEEVSPLFEMDEEENWDYYVRDFSVKYPDRRLVVRIQKYPFATVERITEQNETAAAYAECGVDVCRLVPNRYGELARKVTYEGRDCVVFAEETREGLLPFSDESPRNADGRHVYTDELLAIMAKIGEKHLSGKEPNYAALFDPIGSCDSRYEDWIAEYTEGDLPRKIQACQPDLMGLYGRINEKLREIREELRPLYGDLPTSVFHGEERGESVLLDGDGHISCFCDFVDGGRDVCVNHFLCLMMQQDDEMPDDYPWLEVRDPELRGKWVRCMIRSLKVIGRHYSFNEKELAAMPLIYKLMLFGRPYYYGTLFGLTGDHDKLEEMLEYILARLSSPDEIDFKKALA